MKLNVSKEVTALQRLTMPELRAKYAELFGDATPSGNRVWLVRRIVWRMQALAEGDLSERARQRAAELANEADLRVVAPAPPRQPKPAPTPAPARTKGKAAPRSRPGMPMPGTVIARVYKGERLEVRVRADGFEFEGTIYASLSAVAQAITGSHWNGRLFFGLNAKAGDR